MKIREQIVNIAFVGIVLLLFSCATIVNDPNIPLAFSFSDGSSGKCTFKNKRGEWSSKIPSTEVMIRRSDDALIYDCLTEDGKNVSGSISSEIEGEKLGASVIFLDFGITDAITDKHRSYQRNVVILVPDEKDVAQTSSLVSNEKKGVKLASIPKDVTMTKITLRSIPAKITMDAEINNMLVEYGFCDLSRNVLGSFNNDFKNNNDGTVTDKVTGLMWQKSGSSRRLKNLNAKRYIKKLNKERFAGYSDWRMPTVEELASLIKKGKKNGIHMDPIFDSKQTRCWTIDQCDTTDARLSGAWIVNYKYGRIDQAEYTDGALQYAKNNENYAKAVRTAKK